MDKDKFYAQSNTFDEMYADKVSYLRGLITEHFFGEDSRQTYDQIHDLTGEPVTEEFLEKWDSEYLDDLLLGEEFTLPTLIDYAERFGINLDGVTVPYKIIIFNPEVVAESPEDRNALLGNRVDEESICDKISGYVVCNGRDDMLKYWNELYKQHEGNWYMVKDGERVLIGGAMDINDLDDLEELPSYSMDTYKDLADKMLNNNLYLDNSVLITHKKDNYEDCFKIDIARDPSLKDVYEISVKSNDRLIGKMYDLCGKEEIAHALRQLDLGTAILTNDKGRQPISDFMKKNKDKERE